MSDDGDSSSLFEAHLWRARKYFSPADTYRTISPINIARSERLNRLGVERNKLNAPKRRKNAHVPSRITSWRIGTFPPPASTTSKNFHAVRPKSIVWKAIGAPLVNKNERHRLNEQKRSYPHKNMNKILGASTTVHWSLYLSFGKLNAKTAIIVTIWTT